MKEFRTEFVPISDITIPKGRRKHAKEHIARLAESIKEVGLLCPVTLDDDYRLIGGLGRIEAHTMLGMKTVASRIGPFDKLAGELAEIDENLVRADLTAAEGAIALARRKAIYVELHPETGHGGNRKSSTPKSSRQIGDLPPTGDTETPSFVADTAAKTGRSERSIQRDAALGEKLDPQAVEAIMDTPIADNKGELQSLSELPPWEQQEVAAKVAAGEVKSVRAEKKKRDASKNGKPTVDVRKFDAAEKAVGAVVRASSAILEHCGGKEFHDRIRNNNNDTLRAIKEWRKEKLSA